MPGTEQFHECDLFLLSSHRPYFANSILTQFALRGRQNIHGWGIGSYISEKANVLRSAEQPVGNENSDLSREFSIAIKAVSSPVILGHLRQSSRGAVRPENNHPFKLNFLNYDWLLIHNGSASRNVELVPHYERLIVNSDNDSARIFEYLRTNIIEYYLSDCKKSLIEACRKAYANLLEKDPGGSFNIILSNGYLSFVFIHWRPFYVLNRLKDTGNTTLISTLRLTNDEEWFEINRLSDRKAKMLVYSGPNLIFNGDIPR